MADKKHGNTGNKNSKGHGRPKLDTSRSSYLPKVRVTLERRAAIDAKAAEEGITVSAWIEKNLPL